MNILSRIALAIIIDYRSYRYTAILLVTSIIKIIQQNEQIIEMIFKKARSVCSEHIFFQGGRSFADK